MKKYLVQLAMVAVVMLSATAAFAAVANTPHDLSSGTGVAVKGTSDQVCVYCHTPHNGNTALAGAPLWNHASPGGAYVPYASGTLDHTVGQPGTVSMACLSCHDGQTSVGALLNLGGVATTVGITPQVGVAKATYNAAGVMQAGTAYMVGTDLSNDHPVGFVYNSTLDATGGLVLTATVAASPNVKLYTGAVECATCHNPHDNTLGTFLRSTNASSALCTTCHIK